MATIGLDRLYYAKITEASDGEETYGVPAPLAKAMKAELSIELAEAVLFADDGAAGPGFGLPAVDDAVSIAIVDHGPAAAPARRRGAPAGGVCWANLRGCRNSSLA